MRLNALLQRIPGWVYLLAVLACVLAWGLLPYDVRPVNPEVFETMRSIIDQCKRSGEESPQEAARCADVRTVVDWCTERGKGMCRLSQVYDTLVGLGYRLPPLSGERP